jgi:hypothetical protein
MLFFFAPFVWMMVIPALFFVVVLVRALFWLRSLGRPAKRQADRPDQTFIEGEFVDDENQDKAEDGSEH